MFYLDYWLFSHRVFGRKKQRRYNVAVEHVYEEVDDVEMKKHAQFRNPSAMAPLSESHHRSQITKAKSLDSLDSVVYESIGNTAAWNITSEANTGIKMAESAVSFPSPPPPLPPRLYLQDPDYAEELKELDDNRGHNHQHLASPSNQEPFTSRNSLLPRNGFFDKINRRLCDAQACASSLTAPTASRRFKI